MPMANFRAIEYDRRMIRSLLCLLLFAIATDANENWPQWRGPEGNGISDSTGLPTRWSTNENIVWKAELPSWSGGTPIIWGDLVFVTSASKADPNNPQNQEERRGGGRFGGGGSYGVSDPGG